MDDVLEHGPERPPRRPFVRSRRVDAVCVLAAVAAIAGFAVGQRGPAHVTTTRALPTPAGTWISPIVFGTGADAVGIVIDHPPRVDPGRTNESYDRTADRGPWTTVVRRDDGSLGRHGAVVTYPVPAPTTGRHTRVGPVVGRSSPGEVVWPVAGGHARIRSDLPQADMVAIAAATSVLAGRPVVDAPPGFHAVASGTYRPVYVREVRYGAQEVRGAAELGGLVFAVVASGGAIEERLYVDTVYGSVPARAETVHGRPAVVTSSFGGNAAVAWEPVPGVVAYVGYSGASAGDATLAVLHTLAERAQVLDGRHWRATGPQVIDQVNEY
ncbi:MAG: hypothetical protein GEV10_30055 [Streptosporangiales bacterium]|nr:hypothetical protein [Streptosporangiales bacterium]